MKFLTTLLLSIIALTCKAGETDTTECQLKVENIQLESFTIVDTTLINIMEKVLKGTSNLPVLRKKFLYSKTLSIKIVEGFTNITIMNTSGYPELEFLERNPRCLAVYKNIQLRVSKADVENNPKFFKLDDPKVYNLYNFYRNGNLCIPKSHVVQTFEFDLKDNKVIHSEFTHAYFDM